MHTTKCNTKNIFKKCWDHKLKAIIGEILEKQRDVTIRRLQACNLFALCLSVATWNKHGQLLINAVFH